MFLTCFLKSVEVCLNRSEMSLVSARFSAAPNKVQAHKSLDIIWSGCVSEMLLHLAAVSLDCWV